MWEQDPDVVRWGLHLLSDPFSSTVYCEVPTSNVATFHVGENARECNLNSECTAVENDEIIAHALQEEFSQVAAAEASGALQEGSDRLQASVLAQDWLGPPMRFIRSGLCNSLFGSSYCNVSLGSSSSYCLGFFIGVIF